MKRFIALGVGHQDNPCAI